MRIVIFTKDNSNEAGSLTVKSFLNSDHEVVGVISKAAQKNILPPCPLFEIDDHNSQECEKELQKLDPDLIIISDDIILKPCIYENSKHKAINIHPGILPFYRGSHCVFHALKNKDDIGFTIHEVEEKVDTGDILYKEVVEIKKGDTVTTIKKRINERAALIVVDVAHKIENKTIKRQKQDLNIGTLYKGSPSEVQEFLNTQTRPW